MSKITKMCLSKSSYETLEEAQSVVEYIRDTDGIQLNIYKCGICGKYHLTSRKERKRANTTKKK